MTKEEMQKAYEQCVANNWMKKISEEDTAESLRELFMNYKNKYLWITRMTGDSWLLDFENEDYVYVHNPLNPEEWISPSSFSDESGIHAGAIWWNTDQAISTFLKKEPYPEVSNGKTSLYVDEFNMRCWLKSAQKIKDEYGDELIPGAKISGNEYALKIRQMVDVAYGIIDRSIIPDIFKVIPLKKNGTYQYDRTIPVFQNGIKNVEAYAEYLDSYALQLCIYCHSSDSGLEDSDFDLLEPYSPTRAKLVIRKKYGIVKKYLLNSDMSVNDIVTKAKYLKDSEVIPGCVYAEKSGTEYLFLNIPEDKYDYFVYIRYTNKIQKMIEKAKANGITTIADFTKKVIYQTPNLDLSCRTNPRKFTKQVKKVFD